MDVPESTLSGLARGNTSYAVWGRRAFLTLMLLVVIAGLAGLLGVHDGRVTSSGGGYTLELQYPRIARAGLDVPWEVTLTHPGGFTGPITLAVSGDYFGIYETQGFFPDPTSETRSGDALLMTFERPPGDTFVLRYDAYVQPASQQGRSGIVSVMDQGRAVASVHFSTTLLP